MKKVIFKNLPELNTNGIYNFPSDYSDSSYPYASSVSVNRKLNDKFFNRDLYSYSESHQLNNNILNDNLINDSFNATSEASYFKINDLEIKNRGVNHKIRHGGVRIYLYTSRAWNHEPLDYDSQKGKPDPYKNYLEDLQASVSSGLPGIDSYKLYDQQGRRFNKRGSFGQIIDNADIMKNLAEVDTTVAPNHGLNVFQDDYSDHVSRYSDTEVGDIPTFNPKEAFNIPVNADTSHNLFQTDDIDVFIMVQLQGNAKRWGKVKRRRKRIEIYKFNISDSMTGTYEFKFDSPYHSMHSTGKRVPCFAVKNLAVTVNLNQEIFKVGYGDENIIYGDPGVDPGTNAPVAVRSEVGLPYFLDRSRNFKSNFLETSPEKQVLLDRKDYYTQYYNPYVSADTTALGHNYALRTEPEFYDYEPVPRINVSNTNYDTQNYYEDYTEKLIVSTPNKIEFGIDIASAILPSGEEPFGELLSNSTETGTFSYTPLDENNDLLQKETPSGNKSPIGNITIPEKNFKRFFYILSWNDEEDIINWSWYENNRPRTLIELQEKQDNGIFKYRFNTDKLYHNYSTSGIKKIKYIVCSYRNIRTKMTYNSDSQIPAIMDYNDVNFRTTQLTDLDPRLNSSNIIQPIRWKIGTANIFFNEPISEKEDFNDLGGSDYTTIPWPYTNPVIGGVSQNSKYITSVKDTLYGNNILPSEVIDEEKLYDALINDEIGENIEQMDLEQVRYFNKSYDLNTLLNIPISDAVTTDLTQPVNYFFNFGYNDPDLIDYYGQEYLISAEYLATLPFPQYLEEFDIDGDGELSPVDASRWNRVDTLAFRPDIAALIGALSVGNNPPTEYTYPDYVFNWSNRDDIPYGITTGLTEFISQGYYDFNYWDGETPETTFSEESSVGQIFISKNQDNNLKESCKLEINTGKLTNKSIYDSSGNSNKGLLIGDYKVKKNRKGSPMRRDSFIKFPKKASNRNGAL